jgi:PASTA domain
MPLNATNAIGALAILGPKPIDNRQKVLGTVGAALLPGIVGLAVPLIIAQRAKGQSGPGTGKGQSGPGTESVAVPDLVKESQADAITSLNQLQLKANVKTATSTDAQKNDVVAQNPSTGTLVSPGETVTIVVGTGLAQPTQSVVPDLTGKNIDDAKTTLSSRKLELGDVANAVSSDAEKDKVVSQDPPAGKVVAIGSPVSVVVGSGPAAA